MNKLVLGPYEAEPEGPLDKSITRRIEPWLASVFQAEHVSVLLGNGFSRAIAELAGVTAASMAVQPDFSPFQNEVKQAAIISATRANRGAPNLEDHLRVALDISNGLSLIRDPRALQLTSAIDAALTSLLDDIVLSEQRLLERLNQQPDQTSLNTESNQSDAPSEHRADATTVVQAFLSAMISRTSSKERLHVFTTNYDRLIEYFCDVSGIRVIDRFVGTVRPTFRTTRVDVDYHYNPPGIRGEPRYLEGVLRITKLHGSIDWTRYKREVLRLPSTLGQKPNHSSSPSESLLIFPNSAKDSETTLYPYAELFRDLSTALCRPNAALLTYGYGFGDDHINRVLRDMLTIPSTHLIIVARDLADGRISNFLDSVSSMSQVSLMIGPDVSDLTTLALSMLPRPSTDELLQRQVQILRNRGRSDQAIARFLSEGTPDDSPPDEIDI